MPAGVGPVVVAQDENFGDAAGGYRAFAVFFRFVQILAVSDCHVPEALDFCAREFQTD